LPVDGAILSVTQAPKPEPRILRCELSDYEWTAIKPTAIDIIARPSTDPCVCTVEQAQSVPTPMSRSVPMDGGRLQTGL
jgi:hypothetical protein